MSEWYLLVPMSVLSISCGLLFVLVSSLSSSLSLSESDELSDSSSSSSFVVCGFSVFVLFKNRLWKGGFVVDVVSFFAVSDPVELKLREEKKIIYRGKGC